MAVRLDISGDKLEGLDIGPLQSVIDQLNHDSDIRLVDGQINIVITSDAGVARLNKQYAGQDYATDVLSFSYIEDGGEPIEGVIGDIAISLPTALRQADKAGTSLSTEIALLGLHGVLHVLGYDHSEVHDREQMDEFQSRIMTAAGLTYRNFAWVS